MRNMKVKNHLAIALVLGVFLLGGPIIINAISADPVRVPFNDYKTNRPDDITDPSTPDLSSPHEKTENRTKEVTIGGKVWKIDPDFSYQATGVWKNPNPRPLTDVETARLQELPDKIKELRTQLNELNKELRYLQRIEKPQIKMRFSFGKPPHFSPEGIKKNY
ncbi:hypothetical protein C6501_13415 [Candidatus Poribacteria bacterium]|nr:MAG: hypothetical protein C6501_13415 [Candidatus Poribacteria bacterium]